MKKCFSTQTSSHSQVWLALALCTWLFPVTASQCLDCQGSDCSSVLHWIGDGLCDDGQWGLNFNCEEFDFDDGDCVVGGMCNAQHDGSSHPCKEDRSDFCCDCECSVCGPPEVCDITFGSHCGVCEPSYIGEPLCLHYFFSCEDNAVTTTRTVTEALSTTGYASPFYRAYSFYFYSYTYYPDDPYGSHGSYYPYSSYYRNFAYSWSASSAPTTTTTAMVSTPHVPRVYDEYHVLFSYSYFSYYPHYYSYHADYSFYDFFYYSSFNFTDVWTLSSAPTPILSTTSTSTITTTTTVPATTTPATIVPVTIIPATPMHATTVPATTIPAMAVPATTVPATNVPGTIVPATAMPATPVFATTIPATTVPETIIPTTAMHATTAPASTTTTTSSDWGPLHPSTSYFDADVTDPDNAHSLPNRDMTTLTKSLSTAVTLPATYPISAQSMTKPTTTSTSPTATQSTRPTAHGKVSTVTTLRLHPADTTSRPALEAMVELARTQLQSVIVISASVGAAVFFVIVVVILVLFVRARGRQRQNNSTEPTTPPVADPHPVQVDMCSANQLPMAVPPSFLCPISMEVMRDPVVTPEGQSFDRECLLQWLAESETNPLTRNRLTPQMLQPNRALREAIEDYLRATSESVVGG